MVTAEAEANATPAVGLVIGMRATFEVPPPGAGLVTVMLAIPAEAMSVVVIVAVSWVELTKVVIRAEPLQFTVRVNAAPPGAAAAGTKGRLRKGTGLAENAGKTTAKEQAKKIRPNLCRNTIPARVSCFLGSGCESKRECPMDAAHGTQFHAR